MSIQYHRCYHRYLIFSVTFLILTIECKCLHIWGPVDPLSLSALVIFAGSLESAYSLIWGSHKIWGKGGGDTLDLL